MATCEKCGGTFKPYWQFTDVQESICEHCARRQDEKRTQRIFTAFLALALGIIALVANIVAHSFVLKVGGFLLVLFGLLKLIEFSVIRAHPSP